MKRDEPVILGRVSGLFGVKGWVKVFSYADPREGILDYPVWQVRIGGHWQPRRIAEGQPHGKTIIVRFEGVEDRDPARAFIGTEVGVFRSELPEAPDEHYYWSDLEGLRVVGASGQALGTVAYLLETGANDVMVIRDGSREILVPFVTGDVVKAVDLDGGTITVDWEWE